MKSANPMPMGARKVACSILSEFRRGSNALDIPCASRPQA
jgi:hypothetical protein